MPVRRILGILPMAAGVAALAAGLWTSLARLGLYAPGIAPANHGPLMAGGFVGTIIALERAVALGRPWGYAAPLFGAASALLLLLSAPYRSAAFCLFFSSLALLGMFGVFLRRGPTEPTFIMAAGAAVWAVGNLLLLVGQPLPHVVPWWAGFLILTVAGERIEMSRLRPRLAPVRRVTTALLVLYVAALFLTLFDRQLGARASGIAVTGLSAALACGDIARWTRTGKGAARYAAYAVLSAYAWLACFGLFGAVFGQTAGGFYYDAWTHSLFVGFVLVMIMAHAPMILPSVAGVAVKFTPAFYLPLILLQLSLALRIVADLMQSWSGRQWTGAANVAAVLLFGLVIALAARRSGSRAA